MQPAYPDSTEGEEHAAVLVFVPGRRHCGGGTDHRGMRGQLEPSRQKKRKKKTRGRQSGAGEGRRVVVVREGRRGKSLKGRMAGGSAAQERSDQIRSDHGISIQSVSQSTSHSLRGCPGCLGTGMDWLDGYAVTWEHGHMPQRKVSRADRSSLRQIDQCRARLIAPPSLGRLVRHQPVHSAGGKPADPPTRAPPASGQMAR